MTGHVSVRGLRRGELAQRCNCNPETIRHYEKIGLLPAPARTSGGYRMYAIDDQRRLGFILRARELGFAIAEIRMLLSLMVGGSNSCAEVRALTLHHLRGVRARIADLRRLERILAETVAACSGRTAPACPVIDALAGKA